MKIILLIGAMLGFVGLITYGFNNLSRSAGLSKPAETAQTENAANVDKPLVLVELFTSEGCSSCPPADRALIFMEKEQPFREAEVVPLAMHVDYWNRLGWEDKFSSADYSRRQEYYSGVFKAEGVYTPQMVVDGGAQFNGGDQRAASKAVAEAAKAPKGKINLDVADDKVKINIADLPTHSQANVFLAVAENNLSTEVKRGENGGATLLHTAVVRALTNIGTVAEGQGSFSAESALKTKSEWNKDNLKLVVFVQTQKEGRIIAVNQAKL